ncbi:MAG: hypothetical protein AAGE52_05270 [Myxococcota bacterium]
MLLVSIAALAIAAVAPMARSLAWGVPLTMFSRGMVIRTALGAALVTFFVGAGVSALAPVNVAAAVGAGTGGLLTFLSARRSRHLRGIALLAWRMTRPESSLEAQRILDAKLEGLAKRLPPEAYADAALFASVPLTAVGAWDVAGRHLEAVQHDAIGKERQDRARQALATVQLQRGDLEAAQATIDAVERPAEDAVERWLGAMEALLIAVQGGADEALTRADAAPDDDEALGATYDVIRAHAFACRGETEDAKEALQRVQSRAGRHALERAIHPIGPATDLARAMLKDG